MKIRVVNHWKHDIEPLEQEKFGNGEVGLVQIEKTYGTVICNLVL